MKRCLRLDEPTQQLGRGQSHLRLHGGAGPGDLQVQGIDLRRAAVANVLQGGYGLRDIYRIKIIAGDPLKDLKK